jgi:hypothetical protein
VGTQTKIKDINSVQMMACDLVVCNPVLISINSTIYIYLVFKGLKYTGYIIPFYVPSALTVKTQHFIHRLYYWFFIFLRMDSDCISLNSTNTFFFAVGCIVYRVGRS